MEILNFDMETTGLEWNDTFRIAVVTGSTLHRSKTVVCDTPSELAELLMAELQTRGPIAGHNIVGFDLPFLLRQLEKGERDNLLSHLRTVPECIYDTCIASRLACPDMVHHSMDAWVDKLKLHKKIEVPEWSAASMKLLEERCLVDVENQVWITKWFTDQFSRDYELVPGHVECAQIFPFLIEATELGVPVDDTGLERIRREHEEKALRQRMRCQYLLQTPGINPNSNEQVSEALVAMYKKGLPRSPKGRAQLNKTNREEMKITFPPIKHVLAHQEQLRENRRLNPVSKESFFYGPAYDPVDRRVFPKISVCSQAGLRTNNREPMINNAPKSMRDIVYRNGRIWAGADIRGLEWRILAVTLAELGGDDSVLREVEINVCPKRRTVDEFENLMFNVPEEDRKDFAKTFNYAFMYGQQITASLASFGLDDSYEAEFMDALNRRFPGVSRLKKHFRAEERDGTIRNYYDIPVKVQSHTHINAYVQSTGAVYAYMLFGLYWEKLSSAYPDVEPVLMNHDEVQVTFAEPLGRPDEWHPVIDNRCTEAAEHALKQYEDQYQLPAFAPIDIEVGDSWKESH